MLKEKLLEDLKESMKDKNVIICYYIGADFETDKNCSKSNS